MTTELANAQARVEAAQVALSNAAPQCSFYVRIPTGAEPPTYRYEHLHVRGEAYGGGGSLVTPYPPVAGDLIWLYTGDQDGTYRVVERSWTHSSYGSTNWPPGTKWTKVGPILTIIVEPGTGPFRDEAETADEPEN